MPNPDPAVWQQRVELNLSLFQVLCVQGHLLLALRHPDVQARDLPRQTIEETVAMLSRILRQLGGLSDHEVRQCFTVEPQQGRMTWDHFLAACARVDARVAAMGQQNPDEVADA